MKISLGTALSMSSPRSSLQTIIETERTTLQRVSIKCSKKGYLEKELPVKPYSSPQAVLIYQLASFLSDQKAFMQDQQFLGNEYDLIRSSKEREKEQRNKIVVEIFLTTILWKILLIQVLRIIPEEEKHAFFILLLTVSWWNFANYNGLAIKKFAHIYRSFLINKTFISTSSKMNLQLNGGVTFNLQPN